MPCTRSEHLLCLMGTIGSPQSPGGWEGRIRLLTVYI